MNQSVRALVAVDEGVDHALVQSALPAHQPEIQIVGIVDGLEEGWSTLQETATDLLIIACAGYSDRVLFLIDGAVKQKSDRPVVVFITAPPDGFARRIFEAGADDILVLPINSDEVGFALQKAMARKQGTAVATGVALSPMIVVLGPKGGTGKTLTAANLGGRARRRGERVVVVDLDLQFGDLGLALGLTRSERSTTSTIGGSLDARQGEGLPRRAPVRARVLLAPTRPDQAARSRSTSCASSTRLRASTTSSIVDTPPGFTPEVIATIDASTRVCMVGMLDSLSLKNTKLGLETLELMGYDGSACDGPQPRRHQRRDHARGRRRRARARAGRARPEPPRRRALGQQRGSRSCWPAAARSPRRPSRRWPTCTSASGLRSPPSATAAASAAAGEDVMELRERIATARPARDPERHRICSPRSRTASTSR